MTCALCIFGIAPLMYSSFGFIIRYLYVKASLQPLQGQVYKRKQFTVKAICLGECLNLYCILSYVFKQLGQSGKEKLDLLLYQACLGKESVGALDRFRRVQTAISDPSEKNWNIPVYKVFPDVQILVYFFAVSIICSNIFLYRFLEKQSRDSLGHNEMLKLLFLYCYTN